jgi:hypothetical protein
MHAACILYFHEAGDPIVAVEGHGTHIADNNALQVRQRLVGGKHLGDAFLVHGNEKSGAGVRKLMPDLGRGASRADAEGDGADRQRRHVGDEALEAGVTHEGDGIAGLQPQGDETMRERRDLVTKTPPRYLLRHAQVLAAKGDAFRALSGALEEQARHAVVIERRELRLMTRGRFGLWQLHRPTLDDRAVILALAIR